MKRLGIGLIGCGKVAEFHLGAYKQDQRVEIIGVSDTDERLAKRTAGKYQVEHFFSDYEDLLKRDDVQIVSVCVPNFLHYEIASKSIKYRKNVLVEKPFVLTVQESKELISLAERNNVKLGVVHNKRYNTVTQKAKNLIDEGVLADVYLADYRLILPGPNIGRRGSKWTFDKTKSGGGAIMDLGVHMIDLIRWMLGEISSVYVVMSPFFDDLEVESFASAILNLKSGAVCSMKVGWLASYQEDTITLWGTAGTLTVEPWFSYLELIPGNRNPISRTYKVCRSLARTIKTYISRTDETAQSHCRLIGEYITSIIQNKDPPVTGQDGMESIKVIQALYESSLTKKPVDIK